MQFVLSWWGEREGLSWGEMLGAVDGSPSVCWCRALLVARSAVAGNGGILPRRIQLAPVLFWRKTKELQPPPLLRSGSTAPPYDWQFCRWLTVTASGSPERWNGYVSCF